MKEIIRCYTPRALRNWIRQPRRTLRYVWDRLCYRCLGPSSVAINPSWTVRCHQAAREHFKIFGDDKSQAAEIGTFITSCRPGMQLLDVGAHYGLVTLAALHYGGSQARSICVEASPKAAAILQINLALNGVSSQAQILNIAMGAVDGQLQMLTTGPFATDYFVSAPMGRPDTIPVSQRSLPSILSETGFRPTHVKLDVEGFENDIISGGKPTLAALHPILFLELHGDYLRARGCNPVNVIHDLRECGYMRFEENGLHLSDSQLAARGYQCRLVCTTT